MLEPHELRFGAGLSRLLLAAFAATLLPVIYPALAQFRWLFAGYALVAVAEQVLIIREIGGVGRAVVGGIIDAAMLTFLIHWVGSASTFLVAIYVFAALINTLVVGRPVGLFLGMVAACMYVVVLALEVSGVLAYAPGAGPWSPGRAPDASEAAVVGGMVTALLLVSSIVTGKLLELIAERESQLRAMNEKLEQLSIKDPLTDLSNRRHLMARMDEALRAMTPNRSFAVIMFDLDGFKRINDTCGHERGDALLKELAHVLMGAVRPGDVVCRFGGDEFVVLLWRARQEEAEARAQQLLSLVRELGERFEPDLPITASVGVAVVEPPDSTEAILRRADERAYTAKRAGGDRVVALAA